MTIFLETKRLIIKAPSENDLEDQCKLQSDPDVMQYIATGGRDRLEIEKVLRRSIQHFQKHGFGPGSVFEKESGQFVGRAGLMYLAFDDTQPDIEVGYSLLKTHWNKGYATELAKALIEWGFSHLLVAKLVGVIHPENKSSGYVLEKSGMNYVKMAKYKEIDVKYFEISRQFVFKKINFSDIPLIYHWFNQPHVQEFYSLRNWTEEEVLNKLKPYILEEKHVYPFIVYDNNKPIAYVQYYCLKDFPWTDEAFTWSDESPWTGQDFPESIVQQGAGMDIFIGEKEVLGKGYGTEIIKQFLDQIIWPAFHYCVVDPDIRNQPGIRCYHKLGFKNHKIIHSKDALGNKVQLNLMVLPKKSTHDCQFEALKQNMERIHGNIGTKWIADLPIIVDKLRNIWKLHHVQPVDNMSFHFVAKAVTESNQSVVLKIGLDKKVIDSEMCVLKFYDGHAAVKLNDYNEKYNALLIQQAVPGNSLKSIYPDQSEHVMDEYIKTVNKLHDLKLPANSSFPHIREWLVALDQVNSDKIPVNYLNQAIQLKNNLFATSKNEILLHGDLHHDNVLLNGNEWIVLDPKGVVGEAGFELAAFDFIHSSELNNNNLRSLFLDRIKLLSMKARVDCQRLKDWVFVRLILSAAWSIEDKENPARAINLAELLYGVY